LLSIYQLPVVERDIEQKPMWLQKSTNHYL